MHSFSLENLRSQLGSQIQENHVNFGIFEGQVLINRIQFLSDNGEFI